MAADTQTPAVLLVTRNLPPLVGGMERLMQNTAQGMSEYAELTVIGPRGCSRLLPDKVTAYEAPEKLVPFLLQATFRALRLCRQKRFDLVVGGSGIVAPTLVLLATLFGLHTAVFVHGLDLVVNNAIYQKVFLPCIARVHRVIANSRNTQRLATERGIDIGRITIVNPGTTLPERRGENAVRSLLDTHQIPFDEIILFVGRITRRKGLSAFIRKCLPSLLARHPAAGLVVVGDNPGDSLNKLGEEDAVLAEIEATGMPQRIRFLGRLDDEALLTCYEAADVQVLPLLPVAGDVEGFGMIAVEAAAAGTPTVAFDLGGIGDAVNENSGALVPCGDYGAFARAVSAQIPKTHAQEQQCLAHAQRFSWENYHQQVRDALAPALERQGNTREV